MQEVLPEGAVVRKLWIGETDKYREHVLRLDPQSRHSRFGGGVSNEFVEKYVDLSTTLDAIVHGCFIYDELRGAAELRRLGAAAANAAGGAQSRLPPAAHGVPRGKSPHATARP
jgi:hypothetical protein